MSLIMDEALLKTELAHSLENSIKDFLEILFKKSITPGLMFQFLVEMTSVTQLVNRYSESEIQNFSDVKNLVSEVKSRFLIIISRYSEFLENENNEICNLQKFLNALENCLEGCHLIELSGKNENILERLSLLSEGIDLIAKEVENDSLIFPLGLRLLLRYLFNNLSEITFNINRNIGEINADKIKIDNYCRLINRTAISGIHYIDFWNAHEQRQELLESQVDRKIENNQQAIQLLEFWVKEDRVRVLSEQESDETNFLMKIIDDHRERKLFSDYYS